VPLKIRIAEPVMFLAAMVLSARVLCSRLTVALLDHTAPPPLLTVTVPAALTALPARTELVRLAVRVTPLAVSKATPPPSACVGVPVTLAALTWLFSSETRLRVTTTLVLNAVPYRPPPALAWPPFLAVPALALLLLRLESVSVTLAFSE